MALALRVNVLLPYLIMALSNTGVLTFASFFLYRLLFKTPDRRQAYS